VNITCIAALGQAQKTTGPDLVESAAICKKAGCSGITVSLRQDGCCIQLTDALAIRNAIREGFNLEIRLSDEMIGIAEKVKPDLITLASAKDEVTTEGGLDLRRDMLRIKDTIKLFHDQNIPVSLSINFDLEMVELSKACEADQVEIHTGAYGSAIDRSAVDEELKRIYGAADHAAKLGLKISAGHGLSYANIENLLDARGLVEVVVGRSIVERSATVGLARAVGEMLDVLE
jgi:pyridoxine 5-phosphate synthase